MHFSHVWHDVVHLFVKNLEQSARNDLQVLLSCQPQPQIDSPTNIRLIGYSYGGGCEGGGVVEVI